MNTVRNLVTVAFLLLILSAAFAVLCENIVLKFKLSKVNKFLIKVFLSLYIPIAGFIIIFCIIDIFVFSGHPALSIASTIIVVIAFVLEQIIESSQINKIVLTSTESAITNKAVFAYIDLYHEIENINLDLIRKLAESQSGLLKHCDLTHKTCNYISEHIDGYVQWQTSECQKLLEERNKLERFFSDLNSEAERLSTAFTQYEEKLNNSSKALLYCEKGTSLIEDISESFESKYKQTANEFIRYLENVEQQLRKVVTQYSRFKDFMKPYNEKVDVYGARIESTIQLLQDDSDSKRAVLENTSNKISKTLEYLNDDIGKTLNDADQFFRKNTSVLLKILETYKTDATTPRKLKEVLEAWPAEGAKVQ